MVLTTPVSVRKIKKAVATTNLNSSAEPGDHKTDCKPAGQKTDQDDEHSCHTDDRDCRVDDGDVVSSRLARNINGQV